MWGGLLFSFFLLFDTDNYVFILEEIMHKDVKITGKNGFVLLDIC